MFYHIAEHRRTFSPLKGIDYTKHIPSSIIFHNIIISRVIFDDCIRWYYLSKREIVKGLQNQIYSKSGKPFPMQLILQIVGYSSSTWYERSGDHKRIKPGPKPVIDDAEALELIKDDLKNSKFNGEGYLKVKKRLAKNNKVIAKHRVNT